jgi:hypothetical protein
MFYFGHGDNHDEELMQAASGSDHTFLIIIGGVCLLIALILLSRYLQLHPRSSRKDAE